MAESSDHNGWQAHAVEQRRAWLALSHAERLQWLEDAKRFVALAQGAARRRHSRQTDEAKK